MASTNVTTPPRSGRFDLCSFFAAVDIQNLRFEISDADYARLSFVATKHFRAERWRDARVVEDVISRLLGFGHRRGFGPGRVLFDLAASVGDYPVELFARRDAARSEEHTPELPVTFLYLV